MKKAGVAIDSWKRAVFEKRLKEAGFTWKRGPGLTENTMLLKVDYTDEQFDNLAAVIKAANEECAKI